MMRRFLRGLLSPRGGASETPRAEASVEYNGYTITPGPERDLAGWRVAGTISKRVSGDPRVHQFGRADTSPDREVIIGMTIQKAKRIIDEQGDRIFGDG